jgi:hypothetical protein
LWHFVAQAFAHAAVSFFDHMGKSVCCKDHG